MTNRNPSLPKLFECLSGCVVDYVDHEMPRLWQFTNLQIAQAVSLGWLLPAEEGEVVDEGSGQAVICSGDYVVYHINRKLVPRACS